MNTSIKPSNYVLMCKVRRRWPLPPKYYYLNKMGITWKEALERANDLRQKFPDVKVRVCVERENGLHVLEDWK